ncbi:hypothetical protein BTA51_05200 [Hahella sp. CCB-MM4]|uniref:hypothetical protein n=1 Tax=Hahella sp. (strain CCB-MM4) TaxID=1926491 RepID=UPI000B9A484F|nr:hypothetical protein [Hahella sp. CCB-MM4]OZG74407.1 hypothetical protein BTA51_05200 [Hahella sp. CCB-MM4]
MTNSIGTSLNSILVGQQQNSQPVLPNQLNMQGLLTSDGMLHPAFYNIAQSDLLRILDRLTQKGPTKALLRRKRTPHQKATDNPLDSTMIGISHMPAQKRGILFNQAAIELGAQQLELLYLSAPEDWLCIELINSVTSYSPRSKQEQLFDNISSYFDDTDDKPNLTDATAKNLLKKSLGF